MLFYHDIPMRILLQAFWFLPCPFLHVYLLYLAEMQFKVYIALMTKNYSSYLRTHSRVTLPSYSKQYINTVLSAHDLSALMIEYAQVHACHK